MEVGTNMKPARTVVLEMDPKKIVANINKARIMHIFATEKDPTVAEEKVAKIISNPALQKLATTKAVTVVGEIIGTSASD